MSRQLNVAVLLCEGCCLQYFERLGNLMLGYSSYGASTQGKPLVSFPIAKNLLRH